MGNRITSLLVVALLGLLLFTPAWADLLYDNGAINGTIGGWPISSPNKVTDSFSLTSASNLSGAQIGLWVYPTDYPSTVDWAIGTVGYASDVSSGTASLASSTLTNVSHGTTPGGFLLFESSFPVTGGVPAGTFWLTITGGEAAKFPGPYIFWDINYGPSVGFNNTGGAGSESFQIFGTSTAVPEPSTLLLLGPGLAGLWVWGRKKFKCI